MTPRMQLPPLLVQSTLSQKSSASPPPTTRRQHRAPRQRPTQQPGPCQASPHQCTLGCDASAASFCASLLPCDRALMV